MLHLAAKMLQKLKTSCSEKLNCALQLKVTVPYPSVNPKGLQALSLSQNKVPLS